MIRIANAFGNISLRPFNSSLFKIRDSSASEIKIMARAGF